MVTYKSAVVTQARHSSFRYGWALSAVVRVQPVEDKFVVLADGYLAGTLLPDNTLRLEEDFAYLPPNHLSVVLGGTDHRACGWRHRRQIGGHELFNGMLLGVSGDKYEPLNGRGIRRWYETSPGVYREFVAAWREMDKRIAALCALETYTSTAEDACRLHKYTSRTADSNVSVLVSAVLERDLHLCMAWCCVRQGVMARTHVEYHRWSRQWAKKAQRRNMLIKAGMVRLLFEDEAPVECQGVPGIA